MNSDSNALPDEKLADLLAAYDDALASGIGLPPTDAPAELRSRLEEDLKCLELLNALRPAASGPAQALPLGEVGERYRLTRLHAAGGIGQVWLAHDNDLGRDVALKELRPERALDGQMQARFLHEARITGQLQHPGIVPVYELVPGRTDAEEGPSPEGPYYTMRFVQGRTLTAAVKAYHEKRAGGTAGPLDLAALLNAFVSICNTVAYAHSRGVIHRDLKGLNVVLGDFGEVMVLDWGFAKRLGTGVRDQESGVRGQESGETEETSEAATGTSEGWLQSPDHTLAGQVVGTPAYLAPEQAAGRRDLIDCRTDVYGLGAILYEILTNRPPFTGDNSKEILRKVREEEPAWPETVCPGVPPALAAVCRRALARDPAERYPSAAALGREVQRWLADEPVEVYREPFTGRLRRWARRHKPAVTALTALIVTGVAALVFGTILLEEEKSRTTEVRAEAAAEKANAEIRTRKALELQLYYHRIARAEREQAVKNLNRATQILAACPENLRGWEWYCLERLCHTDQQTLSGHRAAVAAVAFSPKGRFLASASHDRTVRIWDVQTSQTIRTLSGHADVVYGLAYSPDGIRLATASWDGTVKVWEVETGRELLTFRGHKEPVSRVAFSPDGRRLVSLSPKTVLVWDAATGAELQTLGPPSERNRYGLAYSPDGRFVAVTTQEQTIVLWEVETGREVRVFQGHRSVVKNVAFSPDGQFLASGAGDLVRSEPGEVMVWKTDTGQEVYRLRGHTDPIYGVAFSPDGRRLVSCSEDQTVKVWDLGTGQEALTIRAHADMVRAVAFSSDGTRLASGCADGTIKVWDANPWTDDRPSQEVHTLAGAGARIFRISFHPDGRHLAAASDNETITVWDSLASEGQPLRRIPSDSPTFAAAYSPDGSLLATATSDGVVWLLDAATGKTLRTLASHRLGPIRDLAFSPNGRRLAAASWDRTVHVWDLPLGKMVHLLEGHADAVTAVAFSPDGLFLASASHDQTVRIWNAATGQMLHVLTGHKSRVFGVAFSPDSKTVASAGNDGTVRLWDGATGQERRILRGHGSGVYGVAFSPDGRLASASNDWTVKLWDPKTGQELRTLRGHGDRVQCVAFSPDGRHLASAGSDQTVKIWEVDPAKGAGE
jgi:WD40 repeat protein/serine/threonine protein kinase